VFRVPTVDRRRDRRRRKISDADLAHARCAGPSHSPSTVQPDVNTAWRRQRPVAFRSASPRDGRHRPDRPPNRPAEPHWGPIKSVSAAEGPRRRSKATQCGRLRGVGVSDFAGRFGHCFRPSSARGAVASRLINDGIPSDVRCELFWVSLSGFSVKNSSFKFVCFFQQRREPCGPCGQGAHGLWSFGRFRRPREVRTSAFLTSSLFAGAWRSLLVARWVSGKRRAKPLFCLSGKSPPPLD
jgi:hypothetical protein